MASETTTVTHNNVCSSSSFPLINKEFSSSTTQYMHRYEVKKLLWPLLHVHQSYCHYIVNERETQ